MHQDWARYPRLLLRMQSHYRLLMGMKPFFSDKFDGVVFNNLPNYSYPPIERSAGTVPLAQETRLTTRKGAPFG